MKLTDPSTHPVALLSFLTQRYGPEWMEWEPTVLRQTLERDSSGIARAVLNKALAAAAVATRDEFWENHETFHFLVQALNGITPVLDEMQEHTLAELMIAVWTAQHIREELKDLSHMPTFSEDVARYVAGHAKNNGVWYLEGTPLSFAHKYAVGRWYHCKDCGNDNEVVFEDGLCDFCTNRWDTEHLGPWKPDAALVAKGRGKNIVLYEKNPGAPVAQRLAELRTSRDVALQEGAVDACVTRLLLAKDSLGKSIQSLHNAGLPRA